MVPVPYMSSAPGSSLAADFWATSRMLLPASIAVSRALIDFGRPTNSGITMWGNTTTSRSGKQRQCDGFAPEQYASHCRSPGKGKSRVRDTFNAMAR